MLLFHLWARDVFLLYIPAFTCNLQVLEAFRHGDEELLKAYPGKFSQYIACRFFFLLHSVFKDAVNMGKGDLNVLHFWCIVADLDNSLVWVYFHSNVSEYNRLECWGPLVEAAKVSPGLSILHHSSCMSYFDAQNLTSAIHKF
jgi:hypothetical protein